MKFDMSKEWFYSKIKMEEGDCSAGSRFAQIMDEIEERDGPIIEKFGRFGYIIGEIVQIEYEDTPSRCFKKAVDNVIFNLRYHWMNQGSADFVYAELSVCLDPQPAEKGMHPWFHLTVYDIESRNLDRIPEFEERLLKARAALGYEVIN